MSRLNAKTATGPVSLERLTRQKLRKIRSGLYPAFLFHVIISTTNVLYIELLEWPAV